MMISLRYSSGVAIFCTDDKAKIKVQESMRRSKASQGSPYSYLVISVNIPLSLERDNFIEERVGIGLVENSEAKVRYVRPLLFYELLN